MQNSGPKNSGRVKVLTSIMTELWQMSNSVLKMGGMIQRGMWVIGQKPESENVINLHPPNTLLGLENT